MRMKRCVSGASLRSDLADRETVLQTRRVNGHYEDRETDRAKGAKGGR